MISTLRHCDNFFLSHTSSEKRLERENHLKREGQKKPRITSKRGRRGERASERLSQKWKFGKTAELEQYPSLSAAYLFSNRSTRSWVVKNLLKLNKNKPELTDNCLWISQNWLLYQTNSPAIINFHRPNQPKSADINPKINQNLREVDRNKQKFTKTYPKSTSVD